MNYSNRIKKVQNSLCEFGCHALLVEDPLNLYYLTGLELSAGKLYIDTGAASLVVDGRYYEKCQTQTLCQTILLENFSLRKWTRNHFIQKLGFDSSQTSYQNYLTLLSECTELNISLIPLLSPLQSMRLIKDEDEIELLRRAARLANEGSQLVIRSLCEGISEEELAFNLEFFWKKKGAKKLGFDPIIAFGKNSSMPHYRAGKTILKQGMHVLIDIGVVYDHYHSDMTRVVYYGNPDPRIRSIYAIVEEAKNKAMEACRPGIFIGELDKIARSFIAENGYGEFFTHSLGHGIGLDIHEAPSLRTGGPFSQTPLQPGMVFTIEPGIYLPNIGGVRLEDTLLITETGYENLSL